MPLSGYTWPLSWVPDASAQHIFSVRRLLGLIQRGASGAKLIYICSQPDFRDSNISDDDLDLYRVVLDEYHLHWRKLTSAFDFELITSPVEALEDNLCFTNLEYSVNPENRDPHLNIQYGRMLWDKVQSLM